MSDKIVLSITLDFMATLLNLWNRKKILFSRNYKAVILSLGTARVMCVLNSIPFTNYLLYILIFSDPSQEKNAVGINI